MRSDGASWSVDLDTRAQYRKDESCNHKLAEEMGLIKSTSNYLNYSNLSQYKREELESHLIRLWVTRKKYLNKGEKEKAQWWFKTKIKPVLAQIEVLKENNA